MSLHLLYFSTDAEGGAGDYQVRLVTAFLLLPGVHGLLLLLRLPVHLISHTVEAGTQTENRNQGRDGDRERQRWRDRDRDKGRDGETEIERQWQRWGDRARETERQRQR